MKIYPFVILVLLILFTACSENNTNNPIPNPVTTGDASDFQEMVIDFGLSAFKETVAEGEENVLISPLSLESALYMTMNGSDGTTLEEFRTALKADKFYPNGMNPYYLDLIQKLEPKSSATTLGIANTVFHDDDRVIMNETFESTIKETFEGEFNEADFSDPGTVDLINNWVNDKTEGRIDKVLDNINPDEVIFLINALYFSATWKKGFHPNSTYKRSFTTEGNEEIQVDMMFSDDFRMNYQNEEYSAVDLLFEEEEYSMTFVLPKNDKSILDFINDFSEEDFYNFYIDLYTKNLVEGRIMTTLPKFEIEAHKNMKDMLQKMGLESAFTNADFSNMASFQGNTKISRVLHDTYLKVDEKGVEGAAVTTVGVAVTSAPPSITFDKPFLFIIRHVETNTPIFIGKLGNPGE